MVEALDEEKQAALERVAKLELELQMAVMEAQAERNATHGLHDGIKRLHKQLSGGDGTPTCLEFQQRLQARHVSALKALVEEKEAKLLQKKITLRENERGLRKRILELASFVFLV